MFHDNDFAEIVRDIAGDLVESVELIDTFKHPKTGKISKCYRTRYCSLERTLENSEIDQLQEKVRKSVSEKWKIELR